MNFLPNNKCDKLLNIIFMTSLFYMCIYRRMEDLRTLLNGQAVEKHEFVDLVDKDSGNCQSIVCKIFF